MLQIDIAIEDILKVSFCFLLISKLLIIVERGVWSVCVSLDRKERERETGICRRSQIYKL